MHSKTKAIRVKKSAGYCAISCILVAICLVIMVYVMLELGSIIYALAIVITPLLISGFMLTDYLVWSVCIDNGKIRIRTIFRNKLYTYSELDKVITYFAHQETQSALDLVFNDGQRCRVLQTYSNYGKFKAELSKHKSFIMK